MKKVLIHLMFVLFFFAFSCENQSQDLLSSSCKNQYLLYCYEGDVYLFNHCGDVLDIAQECKENEVCEEDRCIACKVTEECAKKQCFENDVYCYNNCGKKGKIFETCSEGKTCSNGKCTKCTVVDNCYEQKCYEGNVYCYTDCGTRGDVFEECGNDEICEDGKCLFCEATDDCKTKKCDGLDIYCYDNCGKKGDFVETCDESCENGKCGSCKVTDNCASKKCKDSKVYCYNNCDEEENVFKECKSNEICEDDDCVCEPDCSGKECGDNGCGGSCGDCPGNDSCISGQCDSAVDMTGPVYNGDVLLIVNTGTNGNQTSYTGSLGGTIIKSEPEPETQSELSPIRKYFHREVYVPEHWDIKEFLKNRKNFKLKSTPVILSAVGDVKSLWVSDFQTGDSRQVSATLQHIGSKCMVWAEDTSKITKTKAQQICNEFDNTIYSLVTTNFYSESDVNDDGKIAIFAASLGGFAAGYFSPYDFDMSASDSNKMDVIYVEHLMAVSDINDTIAHEFQHLCYGNRNLLIEGDYSYGELSNRWIDEGMATASQHLYNGTQADMVYIFNTSPYNEPVADGNGFFNWDYYDQDRVYSDYALTYVFFQYLRLQAANKSGIYKELIENQYNDWRAVRDVIQSRIGSSVTLSDFMINFRIAMLLNNSTGTFGFKNESGMTFKPAYYSGSGKNLEGGGALYVKTSGSFNEPSDKGSNIVYIGITTK